MLRLLGRPLPWCDGYQLALSKLELRAEARAAPVQAWLVDASSRGLVLVLLAQHTWDTALAVLGAASPAVSTSAAAPTPAASLVLSPHLLI